jgi:7-carboxy-7-deazaguanine synthase
VLQACEGRTVPNICFTGGEPALQPYEDLELLVKSFTDQGFKIIEAFTNGTIVYPEWWLENIYTVMDWKLPGSGERIDVPERWENASQLNTGDVIKFTIKDAFDYEIATDLYRQLVQMWSEDEVDPSDRPTIYYGPVWGAIEPKQLVKWVLGDGYDWKLNLQTHNLIWDREKRGI